MWLCCIYTRMDPDTPDPPRMYGQEYTHVSRNLRREPQKATADTYTHTCIGGQPRGVHVHICYMYTHMDPDTICGVRVVGNLSVPGQVSRLAASRVVLGIPVVLLRKAHSVSASAIPYVGLNKAPSVLCNLPSPCLSCCRQSIAGT